MQTIGLIGGMSWESSLEYYRIVNEATKAALGGLHSARCILYSVDFAEIEAMQQAGRWAEAGEVLAQAGLSLQRAGADFLVLCTNTMHKLAGEIEQGASIPLLHIADATAAKVREAGLTRIGLLGTRYTMEHDFYKGRLVERHGLDVLIPAAAERKVVHDIIYDELCLGIVREESRRRYIAIMDELAASGAQGIILGCTEIELLVRAEDCALPLFPTTRIHAEAAVERALGE